MSTDMAQFARQSLTSPTRRPLSNINPNLTLTPRTLASTKTASLGPTKTTTFPVPPAMILSSQKPSAMPDFRAAEIMILNPSKKRPIDDVIAEEREHSHASFSSLINFEPSSDHAEPASSATISDDIIYKSRADTLKLRLQMAMFRVRTNQLSTPFAQLQVPKDQCKQKQEPHANMSRPRQSPSTPPTRIRSGSTSSVEENVTLHGTNASNSQEDTRPPVVDMMSINEDAISGLLELRRGT